MKLIESNFKPLGKGGDNDFPRLLAEGILDHQAVQIVTGYFGIESLAEIKELLIRNDAPYEIKILVGMCFFDGLSRSQIEALGILDQFLRRANFGGIYVSEVFPVHSKVFQFGSKSGGFAILGSSNLSNFAPSRRQYETDLYVDSGDNAYSQIQDFVTRAFAIATPFDSVWHKIPVLDNAIDTLISEPLATKADSGWVENMEFEDLSFELPLKVEPRSNLNVFFGRGRVNSGREIPRPWYEVELIVPVSVTRQTGYPKAGTSGAEFFVVTDDGWRFQCNVSGQNSKNFRSSGSLAVLGRWLKGRLEAQGHLIPGEMVTQQCLDSYGRDSISMKKIKNSGDWYLDFSQGGKR